MGEALTAFRRSLAVATGTPVHSLLVFAGGVCVTVVSLVLGLIPLVGTLLNSVVVTPLFIAGLLGSADAARRGENPVEGFQHALSTAGWSVVGAYALLAALWVAVAIVAGIVLLVAVVLAVGISTQTGAGMGQSLLPSTGGILAVGLGLLFLLVFAVVLLAVQFVAPAAVVAGTGAVESLRTSYRFFRRNPLGVLGFVLVSAVVSVVGLLLAVAFAGVGFVLWDETAALVLGVLGYLVAGVEVSSVISIFMVTYFDAAVAEADLPENHEWPDGPAVGTGEFKVGDTKTARTDSSVDAGADADAVGASETDGFHLEMANESRETAGAERDEVGWGVDETDDPER